MGPVWALLLLLHITQDAEGFCDARKNDAQCYGALGGTIEIKLMDSGSMTSRCRWAKNNKIIFDWKNNGVLTNELKNRSVFNVITGIIQIQNLTYSDSDSYSLEFPNKEGRQTKKTLHKLIIEAPVSHVLLLPECLSKGEVRATCAPQGGDSLEYSWTLNGQNLTDSDLLYTNRYTFINCTLNGTQKSDWVYEANNSLCLEQTTTVPITSVEHWPILVGILVALLITCIALICVLKKCKKKTNEEDDQELTYADVRILRQPERMPQTSEGEVEYGQVKFSNQSPHISVAEDNACIYAKVRR
ncbi:hypothetical protein WMY93_009697 [Mugilogobius chulae]|uniref:Ig-like domain-containing protein n=1 Tax=Mugilogobius chulae TaxID=88201 RepID=A0AAW0PFW6_9GOBI